MGYSYPGDVNYYPQETPGGATCKAQACIGVWHSGNLQLVVSKFDSNDNWQSATFFVEVKVVSSIFRTFEESLQT